MNQLMRDADNLCPHCRKRLLYTEIERDTGICGFCADRMYEREQSRREWAYFHASQPSKDGGE